MFYTSRLAIAAVAALLIGGLTPAMRANQVIVNVCGFTTGCPSAPFATLNLTPDIDGISVDLSVTLDSGTGGQYDFHANTNNTHWALGFNLTGTPGNLTITDPSKQFFTSGSGTVIPGTYKASPFGNFEYAFTCGGCNSGYPSGVSAMNIVITPANGRLLPTSFVTNLSNHFFTLDLVDSAGASGNVADPGDSVPEPSTILVAGTGILALGLADRRRRRSGKSGQRFDADTRT